MTTYYNLQSSYELSRPVLQEDIISFNGNISRSNRIQYTYLLEILKWVQRTWVDRMRLCEGYIRIGDHLTKTCKVSNVFDIIELANHYKKLLSIKDLDDMTNHPYFRCFSTRQLLDNRLSTRTFKLSGGPRVSWMIVSSGSVLSIFPDHTFIILNVGGLYFMWQSYYRAYMVSGKYGFYRFVNVEEVKSLIKLINSFRVLKLLYTNAVSKKDRKALLPHINKAILMFDRYTGVDSKQHGHRIPKFDSNNVYWNWSTRVSTNSVANIVYNMKETYHNDLSVYKSVLNVRPSCMTINPIESNIQVPNYTLYNSSIYSTGERDDKTIREYTGVDPKEYVVNYKKDTVEIANIFFRSNYSYKIMKSIVVDVDRQL